MRTILYKGNRHNYNPHFDEDYQRVCFSIEDIKKVLGLDFSMYKKDGVVKKLSQEEINNYIENDNTTGSFDEFIDKLNTELNRESYTELEQQNKTQANRIAELEQQLEELKQKLAQATQPPTVGNSKKRYNPTERETHLQIIYGLVEKLTKKDINHSKYQRGNNINKSSIARGIAEEVQGLFIDPRDTEGFRDRLTKILEEAE